MNGYQNAANLEPINSQSEPKKIISEGQAREECIEMSPHPVVIKRRGTQMSDSGQAGRTATDQDGGHEADMLGSVGQRRPDITSFAGHDPDLPERDDRHTLSTYEAAKIFEEAECRVSERTIIRWCNKNKLGVRRLDCAFDTGDRRYYISEESVTGVLREERNKGRKSEPFTMKLSDTVGVSDLADGQQEESVGRHPTGTNTNVRHNHRLSGSARPQISDDALDPEEGRQSDDREELLEENMELKVELAKREEQAKTKDEIMAFLRREIDRRGDQISSDRNTFENSLDWFRKQIEAKDAIIERLNIEMRGLLEAPTWRKDGTNTTDQERGGVSDETPTDTGGIY